MISTLENKDMAAKKPPDFCPDCRAPRVGISDGVAYFKCGAQFRDGRCAKSCQ